MDWLLYGRYLRRERVKIERNNEGGLPSQLALVFRKFRNFFLSLIS